MADIPITIQVDSGNTLWCSPFCAFLEDSECLLFKCDLEDAELPAGHIWQSTPYKARCGKCLMI